MRARDALTALLGGAVALVGGCQPEPGLDAGRPPPSDSGSMLDAPPIDAAAREACLAEGRLVIGRCVDASAAPCTGAEAVDGAFFEALAPGATLAPMVGPQGSTMLALAVRADAIAPGDPTMVFSADNPVLELELRDDAGAHLATYRGRSGFRPVDGAAGSFENPLVFVVVDGSSAALRGRRLTLRGALTDADGEERCASLEIATPE